MATSGDSVPPPTSDDEAVTGRDRDRTPRRDRPRSLRMVALGLAGLIVVGGGGFAALQVIERGDPTSAAQGPEGTRTFEGVPLEMPMALIPEGAVDPQGTVARVDDSWSAAVRFTIPGDHEELARSADPGMFAEGFEMRQRAYDPETMQVIYDGEDGSILTVTYMKAENPGDLVRVAAVLVGP